MADFKISRIRFTWKGPWATATTYIKDDIVQYGGKSYVCLVGHTSAANFYTDLNHIDTAPEPDVAAPKWELWFDGYEWKGDWTITTFYNVGDIVRYNGLVYICNSSHTSAASTLLGLELNIARWTAYARTQEWHTDWTPSTLYRVNDVVKYGGRLYICINKHTSSATTSLGLENDIAQWALAGISDDWKVDWAPSTRYKTSDIVKYGGIVYRALQGHTSAATAALGLEADQSNWEIVHNGVEYKSAWTATTRYKLNDIVKYGSYMWICTTYHTSILAFEESKWGIYVPGLEYTDVWVSSTDYIPGDIVKYGGYSYVSKTHHTNSIPSTNTTDWSLLTTGYRIQNDWNNSTAYKTGDVVRRNGQLYVAIADSTGVETTNIGSWELVVPGEQWQNGWTTGTTYVIGDIVTFGSSSYRCLTKHDASSLNSPEADITNTYWTLLVLGDSTNKLQYQGDLLTYSGGQTARLGIGDNGNVLRTIGSMPGWQDFGVVNKVYYVALNGTDTVDSGKTLNAPFRTVKYACQYIQSDLSNRAPATIFIKTGEFAEDLPISIPADVALVGDELRSTVIKPAAGSEASDMFYVRNGTGIRNMTLKGLTGTLGPLNTYLTRRPTAGAYVSLDPGTGPSDTSVHITTKSPYVQNVTTFGTACVGLKIDGALHNAGNRSIVANDFTQVISDGIGVWCTNLGLTELVSVFSYYAHIGYLAENGGKIRATNGNSSYGTYGCVSEGYDASETPITGTVNNRNQQAQVAAAFAGQASDQILVLEFSNAGQNYTTASFSITGSGTGISTIADEFRDQSIFEARVLGPGDSSAAGGSGYVTAGNNAQGGTSTSVTIATNDQNDYTVYAGMRVIITSGTGVGQYGYVTAYNTSSKEVSVAKESTGVAGWDHVIPGYPIETALDTTTVYSIEPRPTFSVPPYSATGTVLTTTGNWTSVTYGNNRFVTVASGSTNAAYSDDGTNWVAATLPSSTLWVSVAAGAVSSTNYFVAISGGAGQSLQTAAYSSDNGATWSSSSLSAARGWTHVTYGNSRFVAVADSSTTTSISTNGGAAWSNGGALPSAAQWTSVAYGKNVFVAIATGSTSAAYSTDNGTTWTASTLPSSTTWTSLAYGNNRFIAVSTGGASAYSLDGITWYAGGNTGVSNVRSIGYGQGVFLIVSNLSTSAASTQDGVVWTARTLTAAPAWSDVTFGSPTAGPAFVAVATGGAQSAAKISLGARALGRVTIASGRITSVKLWEPGSGYTSTPTLTFSDPNASSPAQTLCRLGNKVLANPSFVSRGSGYQTSTTTVTVSGDGYADSYQISKYLTVSGISLLPGPGANLSIAGINDVVYKIVGINNLGGGVVKFQISPVLDRQESPDHGTAITIREKYSQVRLTGHDFLSIGTGNAVDTAYPTTNLTGFSPQNETQTGGGGRVFYTSTDQDGNFRVGELFAVEQATGIVTISADFFELTGLEELSLGGVAIGGSSVVIREFSTDGTFTADSNNIVPTQKAIKTFIARRISGGGSDAQTGILIAGTVRLGVSDIASTIGTVVNIDKKVNITKGIDGSMLALTYFSDSFSTPGGEI